MTTKTERTRDLLLQRAIELFERDGYDATTASRIASAAGVSEMTFFRHFPSKDRLLLDDPYDPVMAEAVGRQPRDLAPLARIVAGIRAAWNDMPVPATDLVRRRLRIAAATPGLRAAMGRNNAETERVLVERLVHDEADPVEARIAAASVLAAVMVSLLEWAADGEPDAELGDAVLRALDVLDRR